MKDAWLSLIGSENARRCLNRRSRLAGENWQSSLDISPATHSTPALSSPATTRRPAQAASNNAENRDYVYAFGAGLHADSWFGAASSDKGGEISEDYREGRKRSQKF
ncbi:hypothetical protein E4T56_gene16092 [Termitomyces sp. T112]|nr:hypothetical protein E4T56_gene16092 [Termitomyces sp. T112]